MFPVSYFLVFNALVLYLVISNLESNENLVSNE